MASNSKKKNNSIVKHSSNSRNVSKRQSRQEIKEQNERKEQRKSFWQQLVPYFLIVGAILLVVCYITGHGNEPGVVMGFIYKLILGLFGGSAYIIPVFLVVVAFLQLSDYGQAMFGARIGFALGAVATASVFLEVVNPANSFSVPNLFERGIKALGGGVIGGLVGEAMLYCFKSVASIIIVIATFILMIMLAAGVTPKYIYLYIAYKVAERREQKALDEVNEMETSFRENRKKKKNNIPENQIEIPIPDIPLREDADTDINISESAIRQTQEVDIPVDDDSTKPGNIDEEEAKEEEESEEEKISRIIDAKFENVMQLSSETKSREQLKAEKELFDESFENAQQTSIDDALLETPAPIVQNIVNYTENKKDIVFDDTEDIISNSIENDNNIISNKTDTAKTDNDDTVAGSDILDKFAEDFMAGKAGEKIEKAEKIEVVKKEYVFPSPDLLSKDKNTKGENIKAELQENAERLVAVLNSFNVKTKVVGVSRGPTITRYEILPEAGIRVRSIVNLLDDISLGLATTGVRIEAPIPGKAAVGIEVPNKSAHTVYIRELIESKEFQESSSKITACLGKDVSGTPIIMDIKKMPHLLIAGATGMGKSVCINSILMSLMYKASPEDVKLILIDPKKVEFVPYNGLPHLLVPVVSDPKKAAGSLQWAVNEMERRYALIESVGVRDLKSFNEITENDPEYEHLPQIVIIIDELADLMATASSDVETSIARIAAKARAAGMHLIIGTQRPSVDVITGVIKANIPSRIAFTVASQTDSRTIIDRAGAENLIGRGDMLYNPVGANKPYRVQGAFVSDNEVESVVSFIKKKNKYDEDTYDDDVMREIETQAALCGNKKGASSAPGNASDGDDHGDPLMQKAMEVALDNGKISTSLLQRTLSVGYGRAAKIIDRMQELGYVSAPQGQKPREVLITRDQYNEMLVREETIE